jgi:hypothetical protein
MFNNSTDTDRFSFALSLVVICQLHIILAFGKNIFLYLLVVKSQDNF